MFVVIQVRHALQHTVAACAFSPYCDTMRTGALVQICFTKAL